MTVYENSGLFPHPRVSIERETKLSLDRIHPFFVRDRASLLSRSRSIAVQRHNDADVERGRRARARPFVRSVTGSRIKKPPLFYNTLCRRQRKDVSAETFSDRRGASRASRRRESRGDHDPARDRRDGRCGNARGREVRRCDALIFVFARARFVGGGRTPRRGGRAGGVIVRSRFWIALDSIIGGRVVEGSNSI